MCQTKPEEKHAKEKASSSNEPPPQTRASGSNEPPPPQTQASGSNEPPQTQTQAATDTTMETASNAGSDQNIEYKNRAPLVAPSKIGIQALREKLIEAYNSKKIVSSNDLKIYHTNIDLAAYRKSQAKDFILKNRRGLYKRLVFNPASEKIRKERKASATEGVKRSINKYKVMREEKRESGSKR